MPLTPHAQFFRSTSRYHNWLHLSTTYTKILTAVGIDTWLYFLRPATAASIPEFHRQLRRLYRRQPDPSLPWPSQRSIAIRILNRRFPLCDGIDRVLKESISRVCATSSIPTGGKRRPRTAGPALKTLPIPGHLHRLS